MTTTTGDPLPTSTPLVARTRWAQILRGASIFIIVASVMVVVRSLPLGRGIEELQIWVDGLGFLGMAVFVVAYIAAALLFFPGGALTMAAGALYGLSWGTVVASLASTTTAALAYMIARHLARARVASLASKHPKFDAMDRAIGQRGWRLVFLLRLSPAFPYSISNYLYGLTAVRFWPLVLASWIAMLPGTFMYVYLGHVGLVGLSEASGGGGRTPAEWALLATGLIATVVVALYVTRIAVRALRGQDVEASSPGGRSSDAVDARTPATTGPRQAGGSVVLTSFVALVALSAAVLAQTYKSELSGIFGPPLVELQESYIQSDGTTAFDHTVLDELLNEHVDDAGQVDYPGLLKSAARLDLYLSAVGAAPLEELGRDEMLALLINAYNACTLRLILDNYPVHSIKDIPFDERWADVRWNVGGQTWSLNQIEHEQIRSHFREPRVHFVLVCGAKGCPPLRNEAYVAARLEDQLASQAAYVHSHDTWLRYDASQSVLYLTPLYDWYGSDFEQVGETVLGYVARHSPALAETLAKGKPPRIEWLEYDWSLNGKKAAL